MTQSKDLYELIAADEKLMTFYNALPDHTRLLVSKQADHITSKTEFLQTIRKIQQSNQTYG